MTPKLMYRRLFVFIARIALNYRSHQRRSQQYVVGVRTLVNVSFSHSGCISSIRKNVQSVLGDFQSAWSFHVILPECILFPFIIKLRYVFFDQKGPFLCIVNSGMESVRRFHAGIDPVRIYANVEGVPCCLPISAG